MTTLAPHPNRAPFCVLNTPNFIVLGAMKAGTTTLFEYLRRHPDIFVPPCKEPAFFSRDDVFALGWEWYLGLFAEARAGQVCGELSTCYTRALEFPHAAERIAQHLPQARFVYILRNPVERAHSHYVHLMLQQQVRGVHGPIRLPEALERYPTIVDTSCYYRQLTRYLAHFPRERFLLVTLESLQKAPQAVLAQIQRHIGVREINLASGKSLQANPAGKGIAHRYATDRLAAMRRRKAAGILARLSPALVRRWGNALLVRMLMKTSEAAEAVQAFKANVDKLTPELREQLHALFNEPNKALETFLGGTLPEWDQ